MLVSEWAKKTQETYDIGGTWGDAIYLCGDWKQGGDSQEFTGFKSRLPKIGDRLRVPMNSGRIAIFQFERLTYKHDPPDMFFATGHFIGYEDSLAVAS